MLDDLLEAALGSDRHRFGTVIRDQAARLLATARRGERALLGRAESTVARSPEEAFTFDEAGGATLVVEGRRFAAGRFETPTLAELSARARAHGRRGPARLFVLGGTSPVTDVGGLQAFAPAGTLFQVASQFNCLEAPSPRVVPVADYLHDPTQGPRAAISCFPGTLLRHYAAPAPGGARFRQRDGAPQINLIEAACAPGVASVRNGYLMAQDVADPTSFLHNLDENFDDLQVGLHADLEVVLGFDFDGAVPGAPAQRVHQCFTSTIAGGGYGDGTHGSTFFREAARRLQRAAQRGTLLAASAIGARTAVLTLIGGGVFGNPRRMIFSAILEAFDHLRAEGLALDVVVNGRDLGREVPAEELQACTAERGGAFLEAR